MKQFIVGAILGGTLIFSPAVMAAERTATLAVENMTCVSCRYIVKKSMGSVSGVSNVTISLAEKTATVTFDDTETTIEAIAQASADSGFPAKPLP